jgi:hypothetical protein
MMDSEKKFDVDENASKPGSTQPTLGQPTPTAPLHHPGTGEPLPKKKMPERRVRGSASAASGRPASRPSSRAARADGEEESGGVFFLFKPGVLLFLGAVILGVLWAGGLFAQVGDAWPWDAFRGEDGTTTSWKLQWTPRHILTILGAFFVLYFLISSFFRSTRGRGLAVLSVAALGLVVLQPTASNYVLYVGSAALGFAGGAVIACTALGGGRGMALVAVLLLAAVLFLPQVSATDDYQSTAWNLGQELFGAEGDRSTADVLQEPETALVLMLTLLLVVALLVWIGVGGAWATWVGGIALLLGTFGPLVLTWLAYTRGLEGDLVFPAALAALAQGILALGAFLAFALPVAAGVLDVGRNDED